MRGRFALGFPPGVFRDLAFVISGISAKSVHASKSVDWYGNVPSHRGGRARDRNDQAAAYHSVQVGTFRSGRRHREQVPLHVYGSDVPEQVDGYKRQMSPRNLSMLPVVSNASDTLDRTQTHMPNPKPDIADVMQAFLEAQKQTAEVLQKIDRRMTAVLSSPDREFIDRPSAPVASPASAKRATRLSLPEQVLKLIKQEPRDTTDLMKTLGISKTSVWSAIAQLERTQEAIVVSMPGERGRRGPSVVYHPSSPELAAMLRRSS